MRLGGGGGGVTVSDSILGGHKTLFLPNSLNIILKILRGGGGGHVPPPAPPDPRSLDVRIVFVAEYLVKRSGRSHGNTLAIVLNDPYIRSDLTVRTEPCSILASRSRHKKFCD